MTPKNDHRTDCKKYIGLRGGNNNSDLSVSRQTTEGTNQILFLDQDAARSIIGVVSIVLSICEGLAQIICVLRDFFRD